MPKQYESRASKEARLLAAIRKPKSAIPATQFKLGSRVELARTAIGSMPHRQLTNMEKLLSGESIVYKPLVFIPGRQYETTGHSKHHEMGAIKALGLTPNPDVAKYRGAKFDATDPTTGRYAEFKYVHWTPTKKHIDWTRNQSHLTTPQYKTLQEYRESIDFIGMAKLGSNFEAKLLNDSVLKDFEQDFRNRH